MHEIFKAFSQASTLLLLCILLALESLKGRRYGTEQALSLVRHIELGVIVSSLGEQERLDFRCKKMHLLILIHHGD